MSTRAQKFKSEAQRTHAAAPAEPAAIEALPEHGHVAKNAHYAQETVAPGTRPSRRSTRKSANHAKTDTGEARAERMKQSTPETTARRNGATVQRLHGGTPAPRAKGR